MGNTAQILTTALDPQTRKTHVSIEFHQVISIYPLKYVC